MKGNFDENERIQSVSRFPLYTGRFGVGVSQFPLDEETLNGGSRGQDVSRFPLGMGIRVGREYKHNQTQFNFIHSISSTWEGHGSSKLFQYPRVGIPKTTVTPCYG